MQTKGIQTSVPFWLQTNSNYGRSYFSTSDIDLFRLQSIQISVWFRLWLSGLKGFGLWAFGLQSVNRFIQTNVSISLMSFRLKVFGNRSHSEFSLRQTSIPFGQLSFRLKSIRSSASYELLSFGLQWFGRHALGLQLVNHIRVGIVYAYNHRTFLRP